MNNISNVLLQQTQTNYCYLITHLMTSLPFVILTFNQSSIWTGFAVFPTVEWLPSVSSFLFGQEEHKKCVTWKGYQIIKVHLHIHSLFHKCWNLFPSLCLAIFVSFQESVSSPLASYILPQLCINTRYTHKKKNIYTNWKLYIQHHCGKQMFFCGPKSTLDGS